MSRLFPRISMPFFKKEVRQFSFSKDLCQAFVQKQQLEENPYFKKYADKIAAAQKSSDGIHKCTEQSENSCNKSNSASQPTLNTSSWSNNSSVKSRQTFFPTLERKSLESILKLDLLKDKSAADIESIWKQYHKEKHGLYGVIPRDAYDKMHSRFEEYPTFLFPLPKSQGYEFMISQFHSNSCYFTSLINYQTCKENAPVCLTVTYYPELREMKGIVLMRGEFDDNMLKAHEAQCLTNHLQLYYGGDDPRKDRLLWNFNKKPQTFDHIDLIMELENILKQ